MQHFHRSTPPAKTPPAKTPPGTPTPKLEMTQLPIFRVHYHRLEEFLKTVYRMEGFDFLRATGAGPGLVPEYVVDPKLPPAHDAQRQADAIRAGHRTQNVGLVLTVLCLDKFIPAGRYIIDTRPEPSVLNQYRALLQRTGTPESPECAAFRQTHQRDRSFIHQAAEIDNRVLQVLRHPKGN